MEDGPKLLPQWLRGSSSSALHQRGDASDASKRGKPLGISAGRQAAQPDPWLSRASSNGLGPPAGSNKPSGASDFGRAPPEPRGRDSSLSSAQDRSWKPRDSSSNSGGGGGGFGAGPRSSYVPAAPYRGSGRDERDRVRDRDRDRDAVSLRPGGLYGGGAGAGRAYARPGASAGGGVGGDGGESENRGGGGGGACGRLDRGGGGSGGGSGQDPRDSWAPPPSRGHLGGSSGSRGDEAGPVGRSALLAGPAPQGVGSGGGGGRAAASSKAAFEKDFPSLRPAPGSAASSSGSPAGVATVTATAAAPPSTAAGPTAAAPPMAYSPLLMSCASSPLLDSSASSTSSPSMVVPYRQTFLSSRTTSNWTSKLAEAPPQPPPAPEEDSTVSVPAAASTPSLSYSPPPPTPEPAPAPAPAVVVAAPRPAGVWAAGAAASAAAEGGSAGGGSGGAAAMVASAANKARLEQLAVRQSKQLVPVLSSGAGKAKTAAMGGATGAMTGGGGGGGTAATGTRAAGPMSKSVHQHGPAMLKIASTAGKREDASPSAATAGAGSAPHASMLRPSASAVILSNKKATQPLDRPLQLGRTASASAAAPTATALAGAAAAANAAANANTTSPLASSASAGNLAGLAATGTSDGGANTGTTGPVPEADPWAMAPPAISACTQLTAAAETAGPREPLVSKSRLSNQYGTALLEPVPSQQVQETQLQQQQLPQPRPLLQQEPRQHAVEGVPEEEEAFLRSLGWPGFGEDECDDEEGDGGLTEEEIAAFHAERMRQAAAAAAAAAAPSGAPTVAVGAIVGALPLPLPVVVATGAAAPKLVPAVVAGSRRVKPLIVAASYGSEQVSSSSDSECE